MNLGKYDPRANCTPKTNCKNSGYRQPDHQRNYRSLELLIQRGIKLNRTKLVT